MIASRGRAHGRILEDSMEPVCEHRWRYFVDTATRSITNRKCEICGLRTPLPAVTKAAPTAPLAA
jgi:hypothetical protein